MNAKYLLSVALFVGLLLACGKSSSFPSLSIPSAKPSDSLAYLLSSGESTSRLDTLRFEDDDAKEVNPDTSIYKEVYVIYPQTNKVLYYILKGDIWAEEQPKQTANTALKEFPYTSFTDVGGKLRNSFDLVKGKLGCYVFSNHKGEVISKADRERLQKTYPKDSLQFIYLYLSPRDSLAKVWSKRDSLKGVFISDSLNEVSNLRKMLGIGRSAKTHTFVVDSTQRILKKL